MLKLIKKLFGKKPPPPLKEKPKLEPVYEEYTQPKFNKIDVEPVLALKNDHLVMVMEYEFKNMPSWVEWDNDRQVVTIAHMNGDVDEAPLELDEEHITMLGEQKKVLLVSNDNTKKIMHAVKFIAR